jgi:hypothetical protein
MTTKQEEVAAAGKFLADIAAVPEEIEKAKKANELFIYLISSNYLITKGNMNFVNTLKNKITEFREKPHHIQAILGNTMDRLSAKIDTIIASPSELPAELPKPSSSDIINTIKENDISGVQQYIDNNPTEINKPIDTNKTISLAPRETLLGIACFHNRKEIVQMLLDAGAKPGLISGYKAPILYAIINRNTDIVKILLEAGISPMSYADMTLLIFHAVNQLDIDMIKLLIDSGANINVYDPVYGSLLDVLLIEYTQYTGTERGETIKDIIEYVISAGIDKTSKLKTGILPLYYINKHELDDIKPLFVGFTDYVEQYLPLDVPVDISFPVDSSNVPISNYKMTMEGDIPVMTIPRGTLLYNSYTVKSEGNSLKSLLKLMGGILPFNTDISVSDTSGINLRGCIDKFQQKFFYSNPAGGVALGSVTSDTFNTMGVFELKRDMRFALLMSPGEYHRLSGKTHPSKIPCSQLNLSSCTCDRFDPVNNYKVGEYVDSAYKWRKSTTPVVKGGWINYDDYNRNRRAYTKCKHAHDYDVCLKPEFLHEHRLDGHIALAKEDSYDTRMKIYDEKFLNNITFDKEYRKLNRKLFDGGCSYDIRPPDAEHPSEKSIVGFPELVIHMFQTDWYDKEDRVKFSYNIPMPIGHTYDMCVQELTDFLIDVNNGYIKDIGFESPLKLIALSTTNKWRNILNGTEEPRKYSDTEYILDNFYINALDAYVRGDMRFYFDSRTGFLIRDGSPVPNLILDNGSVKSFKSVSTQWDKDAPGVTAIEKAYSVPFENSYMSRGHNTTWDKSDILIPYMGETEDGIIGPVNTFTAKRTGGLILSRRKKGTYKHQQNNNSSKYRTIKRKNGMVNIPNIRKKMKQLTFKHVGKNGKGKMVNRTRNKRNNILVNTRTDYSINILNSTLSKLDIPDVNGKKRKDIWVKDDMSEYILSGELEEVADNFMKRVRAKIG